MSVGLAPRPANEEQRAKAVVKTGLIESPNPDLFQVYCDLAKDITGFTDATFSLYDGEMQCAIAMTGIDPSEKKPDILECATSIILVPEKGLVEKVCFPL